MSGQKNKRNSWIFSVVVIQECFQNKVDFFVLPSPRAKFKENYVKGQFWSKEEHRVLLLRKVCSQMILRIKPKLTGLVERKCVIRVCSALKPNFEAKSTIISHLLEGPGLSCEKS